MKTEAFYENIIKKIGRANFDKIQMVRIGIAGAGGLGSNCAANLVRVGFKKLTIVDFDVIDPANLDRQFYFQDQVGMNKADALKINLCRINPDLDVKTVTGKIVKTNIRDVFSDCGIVAECFDSAEYKSMLVEELVKLGKFVVTVSGLGGIGASDGIKIRRIRENLIMVGDLESDICKKPALSPRVNVAAAKQADVILEHIITECR